ncbi:uncharacterized protein LOC123526220 [Mercenaria mercenaria]|uniref:uncharacterized protein LOC123526220 n=1 Tax=Mercenaria mercenaria TaxID=6596 RepID=UPI00234EBF7A|nr:uncharacterized protein LOC123526220 [Mercenaria mercenaria]
MMARQLEWHTVIWLYLIVMISADYQCVCNYSKYGVPVYQNTTRTSVLLGIMDVNDCKQYLYPISEQSTAFNAIMFRHQIAFVMDIYIKKLNCHGTPPLKDIVTISTMQPTVMVSRLTSRSSGQASTKTNAVTKSLNVTAIPVSLRQSSQTLSTKSSFMNKTMSSSTTRSVFTTKPTSTTSTTMPTSLSTIWLNSFAPLATLDPTLEQGHIELCPNRIQHLATQPRELVTQLGKNCYEVVQTGVSWFHAETNCRINGGHLIHIANQKEQDFIYSFLVKHHSHTVWLGLHDINREERFEWTSGNKITYTNWKPGRKDYRYHNAEDCVYMTPSNGMWDDVKCGGNNSLLELFGTRNAYICQYAASTKTNAVTKPLNVTTIPVSLGQSNKTLSTITQTSFRITKKSPSTTRKGFTMKPTNITSTTMSTSPSTIWLNSFAPLATLDPTLAQGNLHLCPYKLHQIIKIDRGILGQYDLSCYEIVPNARVAWQHAEDICQTRGGHLAYISNKQEQAFLQGFLNRYSPSHAVWIGLSDHNSEGQFKWTSGAPVQFTNWITGHLSNYVSSSQEDCVAFIPYKSGQWDDIPCGSTHHSVNGISSSGESHPPLCQYRISTAGPSLIG